MNVTTFICKHHIAISKWNTHNKTTVSKASLWSIFPNHGDPSCRSVFRELCFHRIMTHAQPQHHLSTAWTKLWKSQLWLGPPSVSILSL